MEEKPICGSMWIPKPKLFPPFPQPASTGLGRSFLPRLCQDF